jgi:uncharacterized protein YhfF
MTTPANPLDGRTHDMLRAIGMRSFEFGTPGEMRERLTGLVIHGRKRATAGLLAEYAAEAEDLEHVGERLAVLDNAGRQVATVEITRIDVRAFSEVPWSFVAAEGEGDESVQEWREGHRAEWAAEGVTVEGDTQVVCIHFVLV